MVVSHHYVLVQYVAKYNMNTKKNIVWPKIQINIELRQEILSNLVVVRNKDTPSE